MIGSVKRCKKMRDRNVGKISGKNSFGNYSVVVGITWIFFYVLSVLLIDYSGFKTWIVIPILSVVIHTVRYFLLFSTKSFFADANFFVKQTKTLVKTCVMAVFLMLLLPLIFMIWVSYFVYGFIFKRKSRAYWEI